MKSNGAGENIYEGTDLVLCEFVCGRRRKCENGKTPGPSGSGTADR